MCGINAVFGKNAVIKALLITLGQLERGTHGTGIAYISNGKIQIVKEPISPIKFFTKHYSSFENISDIAIAHNRAPSVGNISYENTHPFLACNKKFALIHNGTAINLSYSNNIREELKRLGHAINGQTDSELLTHILEEYLITYNDYIQALQKLANSELNGAIIILTKDKEIYATKKGFEPLNYTKVNGEIYIASSPQAIANIINVNQKYEIYKIKSKQILRVKSNREIEIIGKGEEDYLELFRENRKPITTYYYDKGLNEWFTIP